MRRLLMTLLLVLGVAGMHTLGHQPGQAGHSARSGHESSAPDDRGAGHTSGDRAQVGRDGPVLRTVEAGGVFSVCLAVLNAPGWALGLAGPAVTGWGLPDLTPAPAAGTAPHGRGPPAPLRGLVIAELATLRR